MAVNLPITPMLPIPLPQIWSRHYPELLPKVQLVAGDMFDAATIPSPPAGSTNTAYVLRNILHDW